MAYITDPIAKAYGTVLISTCSSVVLGHCRLQSPTFQLTPGTCRNPFATSLALWIVTLPSASVFLLKIHLNSISFTPSGGITKSHTWFSYMDSISDFMACSHSVELGLIIASL